jgi:Golgi SNAP receptor complex protein 1
MLIPPVQTDTCLQTYSQFSAQASIPPKPTEEEKNAEAKVQELLDKASPRNLVAPDNM